MLHNFYFSRKICIFLQQLIFFQIYSMPASINIISTRVLCLWCRVLVSWPRMSDPFGFQIPIEVLRFSFQILIRSYTMFFLIPYAAHTYIRIYIYIYICVCVCACLCVCVCIILAETTEFIDTYSQSILLPTGPPNNTQCLHISTPHVLFVLLGSLVQWKVSVRTTAVLWSAASRIS